MSANYGVPHAKPPQPPWDQELADWFLAATNLPKSPFRLYSGVEVVDSDKFYAALRMDVGQGKDGARARTGVLQKDLARLRKIANSA